MCTVVILRRPGHRWPLILAANRDEMLDRPWDPPARHWPDRPEVTAGRDRLAGGTWLGLNDYGVVACVLNRANSLGPAPGRRSRGELVLEALDHSDAAAAAEALAHLDGRAYRTFNLVVADNRDAFWVKNDGEDGGRVTVEPLPAGLSMLTEADRNDLTSPRIWIYLPRFETAPPPDPDNGDWTAWERLLASREEDATAGPISALAIVYKGAVAGRDFGTVSSSLLALPAPETAPLKPVWRFAAGLPGAAPFDPVDL